MANHEEQAVFRDLYPALRRFAAVVGDDDMDPDDIVQDVLTAALRNGPLARLDDPGAYLRRSVVHRVASARRQAGRRRVRQPTVRAGADSVHFDEYPSEVDGLLPDDPTDRAILWLTVIDGRTSEDIADQLGLRAATIRKRISRLRARAQNDGRDGS